MLAAWAAGLAAGSALVIQWAVVGKGFTRLTLAVTILLGVSTAVAGGGVAAWVGCGLATVAVFTPRSVSVVLAASAAVSLLVAGAAEGELVLLVTGALFLGGVTCEMLLGHWYLVDPRLPRSALRRLCLSGLVGAVIDPVAAMVSGASPWGSGDTVTGIGWIALAAASLLLMIGVWFSLGEKGYPAVMAATGLSYLAVLTTIGTVVLGRVLVTGSGLG
ncbi:MAG: hypothetical protein AAB198_01520 [Actinomycetota bacterium]